MPYCIYVIWCSSGKTLEPGVGALDPASAACIFCIILGEILSISKLQFLHLSEADKSSGLIWVYKLSNSESPWSSDPFTLLKTCDVSPHPNPRPLVRK